MTSPANKELILINPCVSYFLINIIQRTFTWNYTPYSLLTLAALTPQDYNIRIINRRLFWSRKDFVEGAIVGITCFTAAVSDAYRLADNFRRVGSKVVLGGYHVSAMPEEALEHADSVVIGEAESVWPGVLRDFERGELQKIYKGEPLQDFFTPAYDYFLRMDSRMLSLIGIHIDRGCKYKCDFCARISDQLRFIKIEKVIGLIKRIKTAKHSFFMRRPTIGFSCDNIYSSPRYAKELFKALTPLNITWISNCSIDIAFDEEALRMAKASGCRNFLIGFETIHPKDYTKTSLRQFRSVNDYRIAIKKIKANGIKITGSFMLGLDRYSHRDYLQLLWFLMRSGLWHFILTILTPFPGTELFDRLKKENRIISFDWRRYNLLTCVIKPKRTSIASVYMWFWFIRITSVFFSPLLFLLLLVSLVGWEVGYRVISYLWELGYSIGLYLFHGY
jgi:radical SAM superfamily enzyme YgiQ (UPF0313 family)